jgi:hypothetical protein
MFTQHVWLDFARLTLQLREPTEHKGEVPEALLSCWPNNMGTMTAFGIHCHFLAIYILNPKPRLCSCTQHSVFIYYLGAKRLGAKTHEKQKCVMELNINEYVHDPAYEYIREASLSLLASEITPLHLVNEAQARFQRDKRQRDMAERERHRELTAQAKRQRLMRRQAFQSRFLKVRWVCGL